MPKQGKAELVSELKERIGASDALLLTEYRGLSVSDIMALRRSLAEGGTGFAVVKNTLMRRAAAESGMDALEALLAGPSAIAFVSGDPVSAAKKVVEAAKKFPTLVLKGAYMDGKVLSADEARSLAELEPRDVMLSKVAGLLKGEISRAAALFVGAQAKFLSLLDAYKEKLEPQGGGAVARDVQPPAEEDAVTEEAPAEASDDTADATETRTTEQTGETSGSEEGD